MTKVIKASLPHGKTQTPEYHSWRGMIERCENPKSTQYKDYGARGITVCPRWRNSFLAFLEDMGPRPAQTMLERRKNMQGYEPDNCCWATRKEQARNKRNNRLLTAQGATRTLAEWSEITGLHFTTILTRIGRGGWDIEKALTTPAGTQRKNRRWLTLGERTQPLTAWAKELGTSRTSIISRLERGMSVEEALTQPFNLNKHLLTWQGKTMSINDWSRELGWPVYVIQNRLREDWSIEKTLTTPRRIYARS